MLMKNDVFAESEKYNVFPHEKIHRNLSWISQFSWGL